MDKNDLILALARCTFLTVREKEFLSVNLDNLEDLTVLSIEELSYKVGRVLRTRSWHPNFLGEQVARDREIMGKYGIRWSSVHSLDYPPLLRELSDAPFVLFWRGTLPDPERPLVAIVGTRSPSGDGALASERLGKEFAEAGFSVVSGLARGIDAFAHRGNVEGGGSSVAVLACGTDRIYPRSNARLAGRILETSGCIMGEYPPGETPLRFRFPQRNRIISGLARSVIVVEAPEKSGALITADFALEQGRDLCVYTGTLDSRRGGGSRNLYEQGAPAISCAADLLVSWGITDTAKEKNSVEPESKTGISFSTSIDGQLAFDFRKEFTLDERKG